MKFRIAMKGCHPLDTSYFNVLTFECDIECDIRNVSYINYFGD